MFENTSFWLLVGMVILIAIVVWKGAHSKLMDMLDARSKRIADELEEARKLHEDAQALYAEYQRKQKNAMAEAEEIVSHAKAEAERIAAHAKEELESTMARRRALAENKIAQAESKAIQDVRSIAADLAVEAAGRIMKEQLQGPNGDAAAANRLVDGAIEDLGRKLH
ncbi:F0F1 ATP synthase subunit B [Marinibaculum pumilum]|uniref:ATP synthase subunit b n=1 Tax=Marinibaculum pumilum TaxID=1766165 RepID=A0ABV7KW76_9PROT